MVISGRVVDNVRKAAIEGATITVIDEMGKPIAGPVSTNEVGYFYINTPAATLQSSVEVAHPSFYQKELPLTGSSSLGFVLMEPLPVVQNKPAAMPEFQEREDPPPSGGSKYWWLLLVAAWMLWPKPKGGRRSKK